MEKDIVINETKRPISQGAEQHLFVEHKCLDHGFVKLVDYMGNDLAPVEAARMSYGKGTKPSNADKELINYLTRHHHTTPLEMCEIKLHCKMPIFVARQWIRHRTANVNEYSARYSILDNEFYVPQPEHLAAQSKTNKQGRSNVLEGEEAARALQWLKEDALNAYEHYRVMLNEGADGKPLDEDMSGLARELARMNLPVNFYTQWYWKIDLHNLMRFLGLRMDTHAQYEIRVFANKIGEIVKDWCPAIWEAFEQYNLNSMQLSQKEITLVAKALGAREYQPEFWDLKPDNFSKGEWVEFKQKVERLAERKREF